MLQPRQAFVAIGANLGDRKKTLLSATRRLSTFPGIAELQSSPIYETQPVGVAAQPNFLNAVVTFRTMLDPEALMQVLLTVEREFGRIRSTRWGARTLDLDLLVYEGEIRTTTHLTLPHPRMFERGFVLVPLRDLLERPCFKSTSWEELRRRVESHIISEGIQLYTR